MFEWVLDVKTTGMIDPNSACILMTWCNGFGSYTCVCPQYTELMNCKSGFPMYYFFSFCGKNQLYICMKYNWKLFKFLEVQETCVQSTRKCI